MVAMRSAAAAILALVLCWAWSAAAEVAVPALTGRVVDQTATLTSQQIDSLNQTLEAFEARKGSQIAVLIVPTTAPETIEQFSIRVAEQWKIGRKKIDDGAILLIVKNDHKLRIEVGYGLEGVLTDLTSRRIIDEIIVPKFKAGDFAGGISAGVERMMHVIDGEPLPAPQHWQREADTFEQFGTFAPFIIIGALVLGGILRGVLGRVLGALTTGGLVGLAVWILGSAIVLSIIAGLIAFVFTLVGGGMVSPMASRRGGWSGGGWSGGGGSFSGGSGGGFSGGGGSFGGGGASGSW
jgi:uncharacterized protein